MKNYKAFSGLIYLVIFLIAGNPNYKLYSQSDFPIHFNKELTEQFEQIKFPGKCKDSLGLLLEIDSLTQDFHNAGYLAAAVRSINKEENSFKVEFEPGIKFNWAIIHPGDVPIELLESVGFHQEFWENKPLFHKQLSKLMHDILEHYSNNGYPFVSVRLDSIKIEDQAVSARINLIKNKLFRFDSISIISTVAINPKFLERHLGIQKGKLYDHSQIEAIPDRIKSLSFVRLEKSPSVRFKGNKAFIDLHLAPYRNSRFDILIGLLPDDQASNRIRITGEISAEMYNKLGQGEYAGFSYKSQASGIQELSLQFNYPYLLNLPFGITSSFSLYSNTSQNRDVKLDLGVQYKLDNDRQFKIFWHNKSSRLLAIDSSKILAQRKLPSNLDVRLNGLGINFNYQKLNYRFNPRSGFQINLNGTAGLKEILPNQEIKSLSNEIVDFQSSFDTLENGYQFSLISHIEYYQPLGRIFTIKGANQSGIKLSRQALFRNEAFRIGGSAILRGFDEESLYTDRYSIFTLEARLLISTNSYFFVFGDYGLVQVRLDDSRIFDQPYGIGTGLSFDTGAGILLISAAVGSQMGLPMDFGSSKIHVGYKNLF